MTCSICHGKEPPKRHTARTCPLKKEKSVLRCSLCLGRLEPVGHTAATCSLNTKSIEESARATSTFEVSYKFLTFIHVSVRVQ